MGFSRTSAGKGSRDQELVIQKKGADDKVIALAGNPNVGKSTVFNQLTGMRQHTGNWPGKTVANAQGNCSYKGQGYVMVDIPGCYSLMAHSAEEEAARDFICFEHPDAVVVVCDATCLERNMNLLLQILEVSSKVVVCVNLMDEARKKKIWIHKERLEEELKVPVIGITARSKRDLNQIFERLKEVLDEREIEAGRLVSYPAYVEEAIAILQPAVEGRCLGISSRWICARLLDADKSLLDSLKRYLGGDITERKEVSEALEEVGRHLAGLGITKKRMRDDIAAAFVQEAEDISRDCVRFLNQYYARKDRWLDRIFTSKLTGFPIMFLVLLFIFWLTIVGANYPSRLLSGFLFGLEDRLAGLLLGIGVSRVFCEILVFGVYRVLAWVVSVMLPPMAIFFPLFTLLEDFGYLPRVAFNLDRCFKKCQACGKQALTMCMGFGNL